MDHFDSSPSSHCCRKALMGFDYELYEAPDKKFGSMSEVGEEV